MKEVFVRQIETEEVIQKTKLDLNLFRKRGNSKTFKGYMIQKMKEAKQDNNLEVMYLIQHFYKKYLEFEESTRIKLESWKGKSSFKLIKKPESFIVIKYQKPDKYSEPIETKREVHFQELNWVLKCISQLNTGEKIKTRLIAEKVYGKKWKEIFSDRYLHTQLNYILNILDKLELIDYRGGLTNVLKESTEIQTIIK